MAWKMNFLGFSVLGESRKGQEFLQNTGKSPGKMKLNRKNSD